MWPSWQTGHRRPEAKSWLCNTPAAVTATSNASSARLNKANLLILRSNPRLRALGGLRRYSNTLSDAEARKMVSWGPVPKTALQTNEVHATRGSLASEKHIVSETDLCPEAIVDLKNTGIRTEMNVRLPILRAR
jgi:hypothetical protein